MPFHLPSNALSPVEVDAWAKAFNKRDFQDKLAALIQFFSRAVQHYLRVGDPDHPIGMAFYRLYQQMSLSRMAFRTLQSVSNIHVAYAHGQNFLKKPTAETSLGFLQSVAMSLHIFWDHIQFLSHPNVHVIQLKAPQLKQLGMRRADARVWSDLFGLIVSLIALRRVEELSKADVDGKLNETDSAKEARIAKLREARYKVGTFVALMLAYTPLTSYADTLGFGRAQGWHDGFIGAAGVVSSLLGMRSEWLKLGNK
mmetsp:Transcript_7028/g.19327  ORF Transcript_7028/g.19327 Transcript_7028/m.19327 type:complete len:255 (-) Transcript_7028:55-819(-)